MGTGIPLLEAIDRSESSVPVRGYERDPGAYRAARRLADRKGPANYSVEFGDFFEYAARAKERCVVANPPYLPAEARRPDGPGLHGGARGAAVTRRILGCPFDLAMLMISSISDPLGVLSEAGRRGYRVLDWAVRPIPFGPFCRDSAVWPILETLAADGQAYFRPEGYLLAGVTWVRDAVARLPGGDAAVLAQVMRAASAGAP
ncbi:methyltransferase [Pseudofrankia inefficax]|uniref:methyltransferase n=1 Tax=Pseudofrankia inefficax (strain DSM 45817 / CECT 9037 / DDB 130130 / EuI1c) TaxID=298654 RepID=UPI0003032793|nr:methyltransferase [Pseudofrankia inefficax]